MHPLFNGRVMAIATMHGKELVLAKKLEDFLGVNCIVPKGINTDMLGTFTGEIERALSPVDSARKKCQLAMRALNCDLAIASEGSFGAHPLLPFCQANEEIVLLVDEIHQIEIVGRDISSQTNFNGTTVNTLKQVYDFALQAGFPSHGLIMRPHENASINIVKDIHSWQFLSEIFSQFMRDFGCAYIETDMRAMNNPTRRLIIGNALDNLIQLIKSECPKCSMPGYDTISAETGLPCKDCGYPTRSVSALKKKCKSCMYEEWISFPYGEFEEPMFCEHCNP